MSGHQPDTSSVDHLETEITRVTVGRFQSFLTGVPRGTYVVHETNEWCDSDYRMKTPSTVAWFDAIEVHNIGKTSLALLDGQARTKVAYDYDVLPIGLLDGIRDTVTTRRQLDA